MNSNQLNLNYTGQWRSYNVLFNWDEQNEIISVSSHFDITKKEKINKFVEQINKTTEKLFTQDKKINS